MEFLEKFAKVAGSEDEDDQMSAGGDEVNYSDIEFIDDETNYQEQNPTDYRLMSVTGDLPEALLDHSMSANLDEYSDPENFFSDNIEETEYDFDTFDGFEKKIKKFEQELQIFEINSKVSFCFANLYTTFYVLLKKKEDFEFCQEKNKLAEVLGQKFFE